MMDNVMSVNSADTAQKIGGVKPAERSGDLKNGIEPEKVSENRDKYVPGEDKEPIGLYGVEPDENGEPRVSYDKAKDNEPEKETVTGNTDKVDREIKALRKKAQTLAQQLRTADESTAAELRRELEQVNAELAQKDNDEYRRQNTVFS